MNCTHCESKDCKKNGWYKNNQQRHQRFLCKSCGETFTVLSMEQDSSTKQEHRPELNDPIVDLHLKGVSQRDIADKLGCARKTVVRKLRKYL